MMWAWDAGSHPGWWWPMMGFGWMFFLMMVVMCVVMMVMMARRGHMMGFGAHGHRTDRALEILRERYARGEVSKDDFDKMRKALG